MRYAGVRVFHGFVCCRECALRTIAASGRGCADDDGRRATQGAVGFRCSQFPRRAVRASFLCRRKRPVLEYSRSVTPAPPSRARNSRPYHGRRARHEPPLVPWKGDDSHNSRARHPASLRCSSLTYAQYAQSSRLAIRAPRAGTYASHHASRGLAIHVNNPYVHDLVEGELSRELQAAAEWLTTSPGNRFHPASAPVIRATFAAAHRP